MRRIAAPLIVSSVLLALVVTATAKTHDAPRTRILTMEVTAYCPCKKCCGPGAKGITASGRRVSHNNGLFVAADTSVLPFHTKLEIPGYAQGQAVPVLDRGGAIKGRKLDVFFPSHDEARQWGRRKIEVTVVE
ncbi:MAG: 3D domain-containing protein [Tepidisphaeraceae bacterium]